MFRGGGVALSGIIVTDEPCTDGTAVPCLCPSCCDEPIADVAEGETGRDFGEKFV